MTTTTANQQQQWPGAGLGGRSRTRDRRPVRHHRSLRRRHHRRRHRHAPRLGPGRRRRRSHRPHRRRPARYASPARTMATRAASWLIGAGWTTWAMTNGPLTWAALGSLATIGVGHRRRRPLRRPVRGGAGRGGHRRRTAADRRGAVRRAAGDRRGVGRPHPAGVRHHRAGARRWRCGRPAPASPSTPNSRRAAPPTTGSRRESAAAVRGRPAAARLHRHRLPRHRPGPRHHRRDHRQRPGRGARPTRPTTAPCRPHRHSVGLPHQRRADPRLPARAVRAGRRARPGRARRTWSTSSSPGSPAPTDVLTWVIDLNAGSAGLPWVLPALNGEIAGEDDKPVRPGIDWLAGTYEEAHADAGRGRCASAKHRKMAYQDLLAKANTDLLPISAQDSSDHARHRRGCGDPGQHRPADPQARRRRSWKSSGCPRHGHPHRPHRARGHRQRAGQPDDPPRGQGPRRPHRRRDRGHGPVQDVPRHAAACASTRPRTRAPGSWAPRSPRPRCSRPGGSCPTRSATSSPPPPTGTPRLDDVSAKAAGPAYARRWDADRTAWMRDHAHRRTMPATRPTGRVRERCACPR